MRDAEGLVQVQVRDVRAELARPSQPDHRVQVRPVDIDLTAAGVHQLADLTDVVLEDTVGRRVGHHDRRQVLRMQGDLRPQIVQVDLALGAAGRHHHHLHAGQYRRGRIGAVRAGRDQADVAMRLAPALMVRVDGQQPGELALGAGVGLQ